MTYFDFKYIFECLYKVKEKTNEISKVFHVKHFDFKVTDAHLQTIKQASELRKQINLFTKDISNVSEFRRRDEADIDLKSMTAEYCLSTLFYHSSKFNKNFKVKAPAIAEIILKKEEPDFNIKNTYSDKEVTFDLKCQWIQNKGFEYITVNKKSHEIYFSKNDFYIFCLLDKDFMTGNPIECNFFIVTKKFFDDNKILVQRNDTESFSDYYKIPISSFLNKGEK